MRGILATHVAFSHCYPPLIYYLTERSLFKKCPPTGKSLKKALAYCKNIDQQISEALNVTISYLWQHYFLLKNYNSYLSIRL
jgi:hypothetical protein